MRKRFALPLAATGVVGLFAGVAWVYRTPIVTHFVERELDARGIRATYTIAEIGVGRQRLTDVVIGDPANPDLTAERVDLSILVGLTGPSLAAVRAEGVRVRARWDGAKLRLGALEALLPEPDGSPPTLPDLVVALDRSSARIDTPWGPVGVGLSGRGNVASGFRGAAALTAPRMELAGCRVEGAGGNVRLSSDSGRLVLRGPLDLRALACADQGLAARNVQLGLNGRSGETLDAWTFRSGLRTASVASAWGSAGSLTGEVDASIRDGAIRADWRASGEEIAGGGITARTVLLTGEGLRGRDGAFSADGSVQIAGGSVGDDLLASFRSLRAMDDATPLGPILRSVGTSLGSAVADWGAFADWQVRARAGSPVTLQVDSAALRSASGARLAFADGSALRWSSDAGASFGGGITFGGGGVPNADVALRIAPDGALTGEARLARLDAGNASLTLSPVRLAGRLGGDLRYATALTMSGPLAGGRVEQLSMPLAGSIGDSGIVTIAGGCRDLSWQEVRVGSTSFGRDSLTLCSTAGQPLLRYAGGAISGQITTSAFALAGRSGDSPLAVQSDGARYDLASGRFTLTGGNVRLGSDDATATRFAADSIAGGMTATGLAGALTGGGGRIAATPFLISEAQGEWRLAGGRLAFTGSMEITDAAPEPRFKPLRSTDVALDYAGSRITGTASLLVADGGARVAGVDLLHDFDTAAGRARISVDGLNFALDGLQPFDISPLVQGLAANVVGRVDGVGEVRWTGDSVTSDGRFTTEGLDFAAAFGPVQGMSGTIRFDDLIALRTPPGQELRFASINPGIEVLDGRLTYQLLPDTQMRIESGRWPFAGGELLLQPTLLDFAADKERRLTFEVVGVDAALFLQRYEFENVSATGVFDGILPTVFDASGGRVEGGRLVSRDGGGTLAYVGELSNRDLGTFGNMAYGALRSLRYDSLVVGLNGAIDGEMLTDVEFSGLAQGEGAVRNIFTRAIAGLPFTFRIRIAAPFRQLLTSARGLYDPSVVVEQNLSVLLREQREAEAGRRAREAGETGVQPSESEDQP